MVELRVPLQNGRHVKLGYEFVKAFQGSTKSMASANV